MRSFGTGRLALFGAAAAATLVAACGGSDDDAGAPAVTAQAACTTLAGTTLGGATVAAAVVVAASGPVPRYCKVSARIEPALNYEMRIPESWNGKLHYGGGGGFDGLVRGFNEWGGTDNDNHGLNLAALNQGYINIASDAGHKGQIPGVEFLDASWVPGNPAAERLYADLSVPTVMSSALELIRKAFGSAPTRSYFEGCSTGGREALIVAQRFPNLFDGVISRAPALNVVASVGAFQRNMIATVLNPTLNFTPAKVTLLSNAVLAACDGLDGIADGVVSHPAACTFTAATARSTLRCAGGADTGATCLSDAQLTVVDTWNAPKTFAGRFVDPGWRLTGNENAPGNWDAWLFGGAQFAFQYGAISGFFLRDPATGPLPPQDPMAAVATLFYDFEAPGNAAALAAFSDSIEATDPDLRPLHEQWRQDSAVARRCRPGIDDSRHDGLLPERRRRRRRSGQRRWVCALLRRSGCESLPRRPWRRQVRLADCPRRRSRSAG